MQSSYSASQWSALLALRLLMGCYLLYLGLYALGVLGWDEPRQIPAGSLLLHYLEQVEPAPRFVAAAESVHATVLTALGCALVLGFFERTVSALGLFLLLAGVILRAPLFAETSVFAALALVSEQIAAVIAAAVVLVFPTGHVLGLDALRLRQAAALAVPTPASAVAVAVDEPASSNELDTEFAPVTGFTDEPEAANVVSRGRPGARSRRLRVASGESS
ncbi:MAG: hypothetical protein AB7U81_02830 [Thiohalomonadaceae bacterium]